MVERTNCTCQDGKVWVAYSPHTLAAARNFNPGRVFWKRCLDCDPYVETDEDRRLDYEVGRLEDARSGLDHPGVREDVLAEPL